MSSFILGIVISAALGGVAYVFLSKRKGSEVDYKEDSPAVASASLGEPEEITEKTLIYITPITDTENKVLYVKSKHPKQECDLYDTSCKEAGWFKVAINTPITTPIKFNWWIVN